MARFIHCFTTRNVLVIATWLLICSIALHAHDTWLLPKTFRLKPEQRTTLSLTSGMGFPNNDHAIKPDRIEQAFVLLAGEKTSLTKLQTTPKALEITVGAPNVGVATVFLDLKPRALTLTPAKVREYLEEIGAADSLKAVWKNARETSSTQMQWRETYRKHAKTYIAVGADRFVRPDSSWKTPAGMILEIVPEAHPCLLRAKDTLPVRVLLNGKPLVDFPLGIEREGDKEHVLHRTDFEGRTNFPLPKAGRYLIHGTFLTPSTTSEMDWYSDFTTLTINVQP
jgi:uncharacterized GH25 family protein